MTIPYSDTAALDADACRALAGAHPLCAGYPDGVPETWGDTNEKPGKRFVSQTRDRLAALEYRWAVLAEHIEDLEDALARMRGRQGGAPDPAALLGPIREPMEPRPLVEALAAQLDAMEPMVSRLTGILAAQIEEAER